MSHWVALCSPLSDFSFQLSAFQLLPNCGFGVACPPSHESRITSGLGWLCPAFRCWMLDVGVLIEASDTSSTPSMKPVLLKGSSIEDGAQPLG